jgi:hypothetical protein
MIQDIHIDKHLSSVEVIKELKKKITLIDLSEVFLSKENEEKCIIKADFIHLKISFK